MPIIETSEERILTNELRLLIKQANQRILRIERETGIKEGFATKQLLDYLSAQPINGVTAGGRIRFKKDYTFIFPSFHYKQLYAKYPLYHPHHNANT